MRTTDEAYPPSKSNWRKDKNAGMKLRRPGVWKRLKRRPIRQGWRRGKGRKPRWTEGAKPKTEEKAEKGVCVCVFDDEKWREHCLERIRRLFAQNRKQTDRIGSVGKWFVCGNWQGLFDLIPLAVMCLNSLIECVGCWPTIANQKRADEATNC